VIYIIDDDQNVREGFMILLKSAGFNSFSYNSTDQFFKSYHSEENDLLILDVDNSNTIGFELLERLQKNKIFLPVIIVTANTESATLKLAKSYGVLAYLRKPVDSEALIDIIKYNLLSKIS